jgi:Domain of unknown function (DUF4440)
MDTRPPVHPATPREEIVLLNEAYIGAILTGDVGWFRRHLADDFVCIESDGSVLDRETFLHHTAEPGDLATYALEEVDVRFYGCVALVRATGAWTTKTGKRGLSRYVDVYALQDAGWLAVSAQVTRPSERA